MPNVIITKIYLVARQRPDSRAGRRQQQEWRPTAGTQDDEIDRTGSQRLAS